MSEYLSMSEDLARQSIAAAVAAGVHAEPHVAAATVIERLEASFGPMIQAMVALLREGASNLPAILQALQAAGVALPSWAPLLVTILQAVVTNPK